MSASKQREEKLKLLKGMGFDVSAGLSDVECGSFRFDLTDVRAEKESLLGVALASAYYSGQEEGQRILKHELKELLIDRDVL